MSESDGRYKHHGLVTLLLWTPVVLVVVAGILYLLRGVILRVW